MCCITTLRQISLVSQWPDPYHQTVTSEALIAEQRVVDHPAAFRRSAYLHARRRIMWSLAGLVVTLVPAALLAALAAYVARLQPPSTRLVLTGIGAFVGLLLGRHWVRSYAERVAEREATARLRGALATYWAVERATADDWAATRGLTPVADPDFSEAADATATLSDCVQQSFGPVFQGEVGGRRGTVFGLIQYGDYGSRNDERPELRSFTGVHLERRGAPLSLTLHPRKPSCPRCGLDELALTFYGDAWRPQPLLPDNDERGFVQPGADDAAAIARKAVDEHGLPPVFIELAREAANARDGHGDPAALEQQLAAARTQLAAWATARGVADDAPHGLRDLWRLARGPRWKDLETESIDFDERYRVRVRGDDPTRAVRILEPSLIVALTDVGGAEAWYELDGDNLVVLTPGRALDHETLDWLLRAAQAFADRVERALA